MYDLLAFVPSTVYSTITYYTQTTTQPPTLQELGQAITTTFGNTHTSTGGFEKTKSEISVLNEIIPSIRLGEKKPVGLRDQIEMARVTHLEQHKIAMERLSVSTSLSILRDIEEVDWAAKSSAFDKIFTFVEKNLKLINEAKALFDISNPVPYQQAINNLPHSVAMVIYELRNLNLDSLNEEVVNEFMKDFEITDNSTIITTTPISEQIEIESSSSSSQLVFEMEISTPTASEETYQIALKNDQLELVIIEDYVDSFTTFIHTKAATIRLVDHLTEVL